MSEAADAATVDLKIRNIEARDVVQDSYIVVYKEDIADDVLDDGIASANSTLTMHAVGGKGKHRGVGQKYKIGNFKGYQINADEATIASIATDDAVSVPIFGLFRM